MTGEAPWSVVLLGCDYEDLDAVQVVAPAGHVAVAISPGRHPKGYPHSELNEDALMAAGSHGAEVLAVADGHGGIAAARAAVEGIAAGAGAILATASAGPSGVAQAVRLVFAEAGRAIRRAAVGPETATTLSVWVIAGVRACGATKGDSAALQVGRRTRVVAAAPGFLGAQGSVAIRPRRRRVAPGGWLLALSDGVLDFLRPPWSRTVADLAAETEHPAELAALLVEESFRGGAGDNAAVVVRRSAVGAVGAPGVS